MYYDYLLSLGTDDGHIIRIALDDEEHQELLDSRYLSTYIKERVNDKEIFYIFLDEIQLVSGFEKVLNGLNRHSNLDLYVTGSNSKFLSSDILTEFRGRGDEVRVRPLCFSEYASASEKNTQEAWNDFLLMVVCRRFLRVDQTN